MQVNIEQEIKNNLPYIKYRCWVMGKRDADHLCSIVLEKIWRYNSKFDGVNFRAWVNVIIKNSYIDMSIKAENEKTELIDNYIYYKSSKESSYSDRQFIEHVSEVVKNRFNQKNYIVFVMRFIEGYKFEDIAEITGIPLMTTRGTARTIMNYLKADKQLMSIWNL